MMNTSNEFAHLNKVMSMLHSKADQVLVDRASSSVFMSIRIYSSQRVAPMLAAFIEFRNFCYNKRGLPTRFLPVSQSLFSSSFFKSVLARYFNLL